MTPTQQPQRRAFTLTELLVVIAILAGLIAILTPMVARSRRQAARIRQAADFQTIAIALDAYKSDFGDYPRPYATGTGFTLLGQLLIGPGPKAFVPASANAQPPTAFQSGTSYGGGEIVSNSNQTYVAVRPSMGSTPTSPSDDWALAPWADGADGPGLRMRLIKDPLTGNVTDAQGQVLGPYLQADRFKIRGYAILDIWGNPILYFPARSGTINVNKPQTPGTLSPTYAWDSRDISYTPLPKPLFDVADNLGMLGGQSIQPATASANITARQTLQKFLGDKDLDGWIGPGESPVSTGPFILWSAGPDAEGIPNVPYGLDPTTGKTDDVANFDIDPSLLKK